MSKGDINELNLFQFINLYKIYIIWKKNKIIKIEFSF